MKPREKVVHYIMRQLYEPDAAPVFVDRPGKRGGGWHYGVEHLRELLDYLYDGPPEWEKEKLNNLDWWKERYR
jgi:hypothetical protein